MPDPGSTPPIEHFNPESSSAPWRRRLKASEPGRVAAALHRRRRFLKQVMKAPGPRRLPSPELPAPVARRRVRGVCWIAAGPGEVDALLDTWESALASSPGDLALLITDDWTPDAHVAAIHRTVPDAVVVRTAVPSGGPPRLWPLTALALRTALSHFDFDLVVKLDTDALVIGPNLVEVLERTIAAADRSGEDPPVGIAGSFLVRPDGQPEGDSDYHRRVLAAEEPRDRQLAAWAQQARAAGYPEGGNVQGGCLVLTRAYVDALSASGALRYAPRLPSIVSEDLTLTVLAYAHGFRAFSLGGPQGPYAFANKHLPLPVEELLDPASRWLVTHSVRRGLGGEAESAIRAQARRARADWR